MKFRLLGILLLTISCGKQVNIDHTALKEASASKSTYKDGCFSKASKANGTLSSIIYNNNSYKISDNSSYSAKNFTYTLPEGQTDIKFVGTFSSGEVIISEIQRTGGSECTSNYIYNTYQDGSISKLQSGSTYIALNNNSYKLSANSSHDVKSFIVKLPLGQTQVRFLGTTSGGEIIISEIQKK